MTASDWDDLRRRIGRRPNTHLVSVEVVHRNSTSLLRPGSGKDQRIRLHIISGMLLKGRRDFAPRLDPECLTAIFEGTPDIILPTLARHPRFNEASKSLAADGILTVEGKTTRRSAEATRPAQIPG